MTRVGRPEPRLATEPLRELTPATSKGYALIEFATKLGVELLPWQRNAAIRALELNPDGSYRFRTILILVGRQSGKTTLLKVWALWRMYADGARLVLGSAQNLDIAREAWLGSVDLALDQALPGKARYSNGEQCWTTADGARYRIAATTRGSGRGLSADLLVMDEVREQREWTAWSALSKTVIARPQGQIVCISNAGDDNSVVLNSLREAALAGKDDQLGILEWSAPDGCDISDPNMWAMSLPGLGHILSEDAIRAAIATDPPAVVRTELLCQRVSALNAALEGSGWGAGADPAGSIEPWREALHGALDVSSDGNHVALVVAADIGEGMVRVEPVASWASTSDARRELPALLIDLRLKSLVTFPGPGQALAPVFAHLPYARKLTLGEVTEACMGFADLVRAGMLVHNQDSLLSGQVATAAKQPQGDGWRFTRQGSGNCNALYAAAGATLSARTAKPRRAKVFVA
jgi:hypothetical protein